MSKETDQFQIGEVSLDWLHKQRNDIPANFNGFSNGSAVGFSGGRLVPAQWFAEAQLMTFSLGGKDFIELLKNVRFVTASLADENSVELPMIGQRVPTTDRRGKIARAWESDTHTPFGKVEPVLGGLFGVKLNKNGVDLASGCICLFDSAGRIATAYDGINELLAKGESMENHIVTRKGTVFNFSLYVCDCLASLIKQFLSHNRDAKRMTAGTTMLTEKGLINFMDRSERSQIHDLTNDLFPTALVDEIYDKGVEDSILELFPWKYEGRESSNKDFRGNGNAACLRTAVKELRPYFKAGHDQHPLRGSVATKDMAKVLDFGFHVFYDESPTAVKMAQVAKIHKSASKYHIDTTLALKAMIMLTVNMYNHSKGDKATFVKLVEGVLQQYYEVVGNDDFTNNKRKKMTIDNFWQDCRWFNDVAFNSGSANTNTLCKRLERACELYLKLQGLAA